MRAMEGTEIVISHQAPACTKEEPCTPCNLDPDLDQHVQQRVKVKRTWHVDLVVRTLP